MALWNSVVDFFFFSEPTHILVCGLHNSGKTNLCKTMVRYAESTQYERTNFPTSKRLAVGVMKFYFSEYDFESSYLQLNLTWHPNMHSKKCSHSLYILILSSFYLIDASGRTTFRDSSVQLDEILQDERFRNRPVLILGNKAVRPGAASEQELRNSFLLDGRTTGKSPPLSFLPGRNMELFMCSVRRPEGYNEGFHWLSQYLTEN